MVHYTSKSFYQIKILPNWKGLGKTNSIEQNWGKLNNSSSGRFCSLYCTQFREEGGEDGKRLVLLFHLEMHATSEGA